MHTKYSPSAAHRWLHCAASLTPSPQERTANFYADQGTAAHALLELCLRLDHAPDAFIGQALHKEHAVTEDMAYAVAHAVDWIKGYIAQHADATYHCEHAVPLQALFDTAEYEQGTADVIIDARAAELVVMDYKHGAGVDVEVEHNPQLMLYAAGYALEAKARFNRFRFVIVQPRARHADGPIREWTCTPQELKAFTNRVRARVSAINAAPTQAAAGTWCKWCAHAPRCRTLTAYALDAAQIEFSDPAPVAPAVTGMSNAELAIALDKSAVIEEWLRAVRAEGLRTALAGQHVPGYKLVWGRTVRQWSDDARVCRVLRAEGLTEDDYAPRALLGVPAIEKLHKAHKLQVPAALTELITRSTPAVHIAPESDPRAPYTRGAEFAATGSITPAVPPQSNERNTDGKKRKTK